MDSKLSKNKWLKFIDYIVVNGFHVTIEHIKGKEMFLANTLSRLVPMMHPFMSTKTGIIKLAKSSEFLLL